MPSHIIELTTTEPVLWIESGPDGDSELCTLSIELTRNNDDFVQLIGTPCNAPDNFFAVFLRSYTIESAHTMVIPTFSYDVNKGIVRYDVRLIFAAEADMALVEKEIKVVWEIFSDTEQNSQE